MKIRKSAQCTDTIKRKLLLAMIYQRARDFMEHAGEFLGSGKSHRPDKETCGVFIEAEGTPLSHVLEYSIPGITEQDQCRIASLLIELTEEVFALLRKERRLIRRLREKQRRPLSRQGK
jgi:hypothetical protein